MPGSCRGVLRQANETHDGFAWHLMASVLCLTLHPFKFPFDTKLEVSDLQSKA